MREALPHADATSDSLIADVVDEFTGRLNRGESPSVDPYLAQYPDLAEPLRRVLQTLLLVHQPAVQSPEADVPGAVLIAEGDRASGLAARR